MRGYRKLRETWRHGKAWHFRDLPAIGYIKRAAVNAALFANCSHLGAGSLRLSLTSRSKKHYIPSDGSWESRMRVMKACCAIGILAFLAVAPVSVLAGINNLVTWDPVSDPGVTEILIYRSTTEDIGGFSLVASVSSSVTSFSDTPSNGLVPGVTYYYRLRSRNAAGTVSGFSSQMSARYNTPSCAAAYQDRCRINSVTSEDGTSWQVDWSTVDPAVCRLEYWKMGTQNVLVTQNEGISSTTHSQTLSGLDPESVYFVHAIARSEDGKDMTVSADFTFATTTGAVALEFVVDPAGLTIGEGQSGSFDVSLNTVPPGVVTVRVQRIAGDSDITISSGSYLSFSPSDWYVGKTVVLSAAEDGDEIEGEAIFRIEGISGPEVASYDMVVGEAENDIGNSNNGALAEAVVGAYPMPYQPALGTLTIDNRPAEGRAAIFDLRGQEVWNDTWNGSDTIYWDGLNNSGVGVASGRYFLVVTSADGSIKERKVILVVN
jgi:hypothetical protein